MFFDFQYHRVDTVIIDTLMSISNFLMAFFYFTIVLYCCDRNLQSLTHSKSLFHKLSCSLIPVVIPSIVVENLLSAYRRIVPHFSLLLSLLLIDAYKLDWFLPILCIAFFNSIIVRYGMFSHRIFVLKLIFWSLWLPFGP